MKWLQKKLLYKISYWCCVCNLSISGVQEWRSWAGSETGTRERRRNGRLETEPWPKNGKALQESLLNQVWKMCDTDWYIDTHGASRSYTEMVSFCCKILDVCAPVRYIIKPGVHLNFGESARNFTWIKHKWNEWCKVIMYVNLSWFTHCKPFLLSYMSIVRVVVRNSHWNALNMAGCKGRPMTGFDVEYIYIYTWFNDESEGQFGSLWWFIPTRFEASQIDQNGWGSSCRST